MSHGFASDSRTRDHQGRSIHTANDDDDDVDDNQILIPQYRFIQQMIMMTAAKHPPTNLDIFFTFFQTGGGGAFLPQKLSAEYFLYLGVGAFLSVLSSSANLPCFY